MTFEPLSDRFVHQLERSLVSPPTPVPSTDSPSSSPKELFLSEVPEQPLAWLWPDRLPLGHLTLLDATPGSDSSLLALTLAACVSAGKPLPGGTPTLPGNVILFAPYDSASATLKPRLQAAGGDPSRILLLRSPGENPSRPTTHTPSFALPRDLDHLAATIRRLDARLLILDSVSAIPGLSRCLPALCELARQTNCAILLIRSLSRPPADLLRPSGPPAPLHEAVRSRLLLTPDPADERHHLVIPVWHPLCVQSPILACETLFSDEGIPALHWLAERDHTPLVRLSTGPLYSPHRQAILRFLHHSDSPRSIPDILEATCYDREAGRKMLVRMKLAGELVSPARGLYTTATHPSLASLPTDPLSVHNVPTASDNPSQGTGAGLPPLACPRPGNLVPGIGASGACPRPGSSVSNVPTTPDMPLLPQSIDMKTILSSLSPSPSPSYSPPRYKTLTVPKAATAVSPSKEPLL